MDSNQKARFENHSNIFLKSISCLFLLILTYFCLSFCVFFVGLHMNKKSQIMEYYPDYLYEKTKYFADCGITLVIIYITKIFAFFSLYFSEKKPFLLICSRYYIIINSFLVLSLLLQVITNIPHFNQKKRVFNDQSIFYSIFYGKYYCSNMVSYSVAELVLLTLFLQEYRGGKTVFFLWFVTFFLSFVQISSKIHYSVEIVVSLYLIIIEFLSYHIVVQRKSMLLGDPSVFIKFLLFFDVDDTSTFIVEEKDDGSSSI